MNLKSEFLECPTCGSPHIRKFRKDYTRRFQKEIYIVPDLEYHECQDCGEQLFSPDAIRKIQEYSPTFKQRREAMLKESARQKAEVVKEQPGRYGAKKKKTPASRKPRQ